jgi:predicted enzyme related to lactoylglutathione lyase
MSNAEVLGRFVWHELMTSDTAAAAAFYPKVLPWRTAPSNMPGYTIWMAGQAQIGGLMAQPADSGGAPPHWLIYLGTPNVDATCTQAQGHGARVVKAPGDIPNVGRFAVLADPQGATFAVFTPAAGAPPPATPAQGGFSWHELTTTDANAALRFYGELFGWRKGPGHDMGGGRGVYQIFEHAGTQVGGITPAQGAASAPAWLSYVQVADSSRAVAAAKAAGGRVVIGPMEVPGGSWIAVMTDPQGGAFAVHQLAIAASQPKGTPPTLKPAAPAKPPAPPKPAAVASKPAPAPAPKPVPAAKPAEAPKPAATKPAAAPKPAATKPAAKSAKKAKPVKKAKKKAKKKVARKAAKKAARKPAKAKGKSRKSARRSVRRSAGRGARGRARGRRRR